MSAKRRGKGAGRGKGSAGPKGEGREEAAVRERGGTGGRAAGEGGEGSAGRRSAGTRGAVAGSAVPDVGRWVPALLYAALTLVLFREFVFSDLMLFGNDTLGLGYVTRAFYAQSLADGFFPRWAPDLLGGTPFLEALSGGDSLYPPSLLLLLLLEPYRALGWKLVVHIAAAGFLMFAWVRTLGGSRAAALLGGAAYMLAPYLVSLVAPGHDGKIFVTALAPLLFLTVERLFERAALTRFAAISAVVSLVILTTHFQMAYFLFGAVGLYAVFRTMQLARTQPAANDRPATPARSATPAEEAAGAPAPSSAGAGAGRVAGIRFALFLAAAVAGAGIAAVQLVPAVAYVSEYSRRIQTTREAAQETGVAWSSSWSLHPEEAMALLIPEFAGNDGGGADWKQGTYWGRNPTKDNHEGAGVVVLLLATVALVTGAGAARRWFFAGLAALALLFALGAHTPVWRLFYEVVPGIRLFRAPSQVMFLFAFSAATLGALGLDALLARARGGGGAAAKGAPELRALWIFAGVLVALALLASTGALTSMWTAVVYSGAEADRLQRLAALQPFLVRGAWISALLGLGTAALAWAHRGGWLPSGALVGALVALVVADELRVSSGFIQVLDFEEWSAPDPNVRAVLEREAGSTDPWRMLSFRQLGQDVRPALHGIELAAGHHPNDLSRYRELIGMVGSGLPQNLLDDDIRRLLNVRYILWPDYQFGGSLDGPVLSRTALPDGRPYESVLADQGLPRARLVGAATVRSDEEAVAYMLSDAFDPEREVVLAEEPPIALDGAPASGTVTWEERTPNRLRLAVSTERPALLVVADNWFPAWHATVDGADAPLLRAYHTLRAVPVPAGEHTVEMVYRSGVVRASLLVSLLVLAGLAGAVGLSLRRGLSSRREP